MRTDRETPIQIAIVKWLEANFPSWIVHHCKMEINKSGKAIQIEIAKAKRKGSKPGFPDLLVLPPAVVGPVFLEVKSPGNYPSEAQREMHAALADLGYRVAVVWSVDDVEAVFAEWGVRAGAVAVPFRSFVS